MTLEGLLSRLAMIGAEHHVETTRHKDWVRVFIVMNNQTLGRASIECGKLNTLRMYSHPNHMQPDRTFQHYRVLAAVNLGVVLEREHFDLALKRSMEYAEQVVADKVQWRKDNPKNPNSRGFRPKLSTPNYTGYIWSYLFHDSDTGTLHAHLQA